MPSAVNELLCFFFPSDFFCSQVPWGTAALCSKVFFFFHQPQLVCREELTGCKVRWLAYFWGLELQRDSLKGQMKEKNNSVTIETFLNALSVEFVLSNKDLHNL